MTIHFCIMCVVLISFCETSIKNLFTYLEHTNSRTSKSQNKISKGCNILDCFINEYYIFALIRLYNKIQCLSIILWNCYWNNLLTVPRIQIATSFYHSLLKYDLCFLSRYLIVDRWKKITCKRVLFDRKILSTYLKNCDIVPVSGTKGSTFHKF